MTLRVALLQALTWYRTPHSQAEAVPQSPVLATRCDAAYERMDGLAASPLGGGDCWTVGSPNNGQGISLAAWEVAVRQGEVAWSA